MAGKFRGCIWFNGDAQAAADYYTDVFPNASIEKTSYFNESTPERNGDVLIIGLKLDDQEYLLLNGGPEFPHSEYFSIEVMCDGQEEVDRIWDRFVGDGGQESQCGWCKDKFGVNWQVVPEQFYDAMIENPAVTTAMYGMTKIIVSDLEKAAKGES